MRFLFRLLEKTWFEMNMKRLIAAIGWDLKLQVKYQILTVAVIITVLYTLIFKLLVREEFDEILRLLIFTDPAMLGFMFIGVLVLFEKSSNTLDALVVTPLRIPEYLFAKVASLGIIATACALVMAVAGHGPVFNYPLYIYAVFMTSAIVTLLGFAGASRIRSFNQYIIIIPQFLAPLALPLLNFFGLTDSWLLYILPTQATLNLLWASFHSIPPVDMVYSLLYLPVWLLLSYYFAAFSFRKHILVSSKA
jgi:fluoroquinolone transport system permease protein